MIVQLILGFGLLLIGYRIQKIVRKLDKLRKMEGEDGEGKDE